MGKEKTKGRAGLWPSLSCVLSTPTWWYEFQTPLYKKCIYIATQKVSEKKTINKDTEWLSGKE